MTKEKFIEAYKETIPRILKSRSFLREGILKVVPEEEKNHVKDYLQGYGNGSQIEMEDLNADFAEAFKKELKKAEDDLTFCGDILHSLRLEMPCASLEKIAPKFDDYELGLAKKVRENAFVFDDIALLSDDSVKLILKECDTQDLAKALKLANETTKEKIFSNMAERELLMLQEDMEFMGTIRKFDVIESQRKIISIVFSLHAEGKI